MTTFLQLGVIKPISVLNVKEVGFLFDLLDKFSIIIPLHLLFVTRKHWIRSCLLEERTFTTTLRGKKKQKQSGYHYLTDWTWVDPAKKIGGSLAKFCKTPVGEGRLRFEIIKYFVGAKGINQDGEGIQPPFCPPPDPPLLNHEQSMCWFKSGHNWLT